MRRLLILLACLAALAAPPARAQVAPQLAQLTYPADGAVAVSPRVAFSWSAVEGATGYYLYVGTTVGAKDVVNSGEMTSTVVAPIALPGGQILHARLWTRTDGVWRSTDSTFTTDLLPVLVAPRQGAVNVDALPEFRWTPVEGAESYYLYVGTSAGGKDVLNSGELAGTRFQAVDSLPAGRVLYATTWAKVSGVWRSTQSEFITDALARFENIRDGQQGVDLGLPVRWTSVEGGTYTLYVGSSPGASDLLKTPNGPASSVSLRAIKAGTTLYLRLWTKSGIGWRYTDATITSAPRSVLVYPGGPDAEYNPAIRVSWSETEGAEAYYLYAGSAPGLKDYVDSGQTTSREAVGTGIPGGATVHLRLWTRLAGVWRFVDSSKPVRPVAWPRVPRDGSGKSPVQGTISWNAVQGADRYYVYVGTALGTRDIVNSGELTATSFAYPALPGGRLVYLRLWTRHGGTWRYVDATVDTQPAVDVTSLQPGARDVTPEGFVLEWEPLANATRYHVLIGTSNGGRDVWDSYSFSSAQTSRVLPDLPPGTLLYLRIYSEVGGIWFYRDVQFTTLPRARLVSPLTGSSDVELYRLLAEWTPVPGASEFRIEVGTAAGSADAAILSGISGNSSSATLPPLPAGFPLHVRLWTRKAAAWYYSDAEFTGRGRPNFTNPVQSQTDVGVATQFRWVPVAGATRYELLVGSVAGASDVYSSGLISATGATVTGMPPDGVVHARLRAWVDGKARSADITFATGEWTSPFSFLAPVASGDTLQPGAAIAWVSDPLAESYRLQVGTSPGDNDLLDTGLVHAHRRLLEEVPRDVPLHLTLTGYHPDGRTRTISSVVVIASGAPTFAQRLELALELVAEVRSMADIDNEPRGGTLLPAVVRDEGKWAANCVSYAIALSQLMAEEALGIESRHLAVCLNPNTYDCHTLVEARDPATGRWVLLDPTFAMAPQRAADGEMATAVELSAATRALNWGAITYRFLTPDGDRYARSYYLDYPLLYDLVYESGQQSFRTSVPPDIDSYLESVGAASGPVPGTYAAKCISSALPAQVQFDQQVLSLPCESPYGISVSAGGTNVSIAGPDANATELVRIRRFVF